MEETAYLALAEAEDHGWLEVIGASQHNLRDIDVRLPLRRLVCITGVSGSGKSTLLQDVLHPALLKHLGRPSEAAGAHRGLRGIEHISYFQVDNPLVPVIDPVFVGLHATSDDSSGEMSSKMVTKAHAAEKVGHFCAQRGRTVVIEYSDLPAAVQQEKGPDGELRYRAGSIAIHTLDRAFVILDEAQNTTVSQMKMFLTRMGPSSKFIVTGDPSQTDLPPRTASGLPHALRLLAGMTGIGRIELDGRDVVRHPLVRKIIAAYDAEGQKMMAARSESEAPKAKSKPQNPES